jgi:hypothetical protein
MIAFAAPRCRICQCGSPGREFSDTTRRPLLARGVAPTAADVDSALVHPAAAAATPNAPKPRNARLLVSPAGPLSSRVMADRMHPRRRPRKQDASLAAQTAGRSA